MPTGSDYKAARNADPNRAIGVRFSGDRMVIELQDGRELSVLLERYPTLRDASAKEREQWELLGRGKAIHWESLDFDLSVEALLGGLPEKFPAPPSLDAQSVTPSAGSPRPSKSRRRAG